MSTGKHHLQGPEDLRCLACTRPLPVARGRQAYCDQTCRQAAFRRRHAPTLDHQALAPPPARSRRAGTIYTCPACDSRFLGEQRCTDCNTFATRLGPGGSCPDCDSLITIDELLTLA